MLLKGNSVNSQWSFKNNTFQHMPFCCMLRQKLPNEFWFPRSHAVKSHTSRLIFKCCVFYSSPFYTRDRIHIRTNWTMYE